MFKFAGKMLSQNLLFGAVFIIVLGMFVVNYYENVKESNARDEAISQSSAPRTYYFNEQVNWKGSINDLDKYNWADGKQYSFNKNKPLDEQNIPDFMVLTEQEGNDKPLINCSTNYDTCGVAMVVKDAETGKVVGEFKNEDMTTEGTTLFSILGTINETEGMTTMNATPEEIREQAGIDKLQNHITYDVQFYTVKDGVVEVQGSINGSSNRDWYWNLTNLSWDIDTQDENSGYYYRSYISLRN